MKVIRTLKAQWVGVGIIWAALVAVGFFQLWKYDTEPGLLGMAPPHWPADSQLKLSKTGSTLVVFAHPRCPCTRASLEELSKLMEEIHNKAVVKIVFYKPEKFGIDWVKTDLWEKAKKISNAENFIDVTGKEIELFQAKTSGQVYVYDKDSSLVYSGGITRGRGHVGPSRGSQVIKKYVFDGVIEESGVSVFGCSLFHDGEESEKDIAIAEGAKG